MEEDGLVYNFILPTDIMCSIDEEPSGLKVFFIIVAVAFSAYCLIGITYKRYVHNAQKCQQLPHINFWSRVGNSLAVSTDNYITFISYFSSGNNYWQDGACATLKVRFAALFISPKVCP